MTTDEGHLEGGPEAPGPAADEADSGGPVAVGTQPSRRSTILRTGFIVGVLVVVFGLILPQFIDYQDIIEAFQELEPIQIVIITIIGLFAWVASGAVFSALIPGLSLLRGTEAWLILSGTGASIPAGPWNMAVVWVVVRGWGMSNAATTSGIALYGVADMLSRMAMPLLVIVPLFLTGELDPGSQTRAVTFIALAGVVGFFVFGGVILAIVRSERLAEAIGRRSQVIAEWVSRRLGRKEKPEVHGAVLRFRDQMGAVIRSRGRLAIVVAIASKIVWSFVLIVAMRMVGVPSEAVSDLQIVAVYSLTWIILIVPIAPGGAGVPELIMISAFSSITGGQYTTEISAGVFLFRIYQWFLPIPLAWILLKLVRRGKPMLPTGAELRAAAKGAPLAEAA